MADLIQMRQREVVVNLAFRSPELVIDRVPIKPQTVIDSVNKKQLTAVVNKMTGKLCILSNVPKDAPFTAGHSWLKLSTETNNTTYGLWPDDHPAVIDNGDESDVRIGREDKLSFKASYCQMISKDQSIELEQILKKNHTWRYTNTCASFASETFKKVTGVNISANDTFGFETPRTISESIEKAKEK